MAQTLQVRWLTSTKLAITPGRPYHNARLLKTLYLLKRLGLGYRLCSNALLTNLSRILTSCYGLAHWRIFFFRLNKPVQMVYSTSPVVTNIFPDSAKDLAGSSFP